MLFWTGAAASSTASPPAKKRTLTLKAKRKKEPACYSKQYPHADEVEKRRNNIISIFRDKTPVECFEQLLDEAIIEDIVRQNVRYATQNNSHQFQLTNACMKKFVGILLFTGYHFLPQEQLYWCEDEDMDVQCVRKCMSRNRYLEIKRYLHLNDNSDLEKIPAADRDRLFKIRPLLEKLKKTF